jgi:hypothetical protein
MLYIFTSNRSLNVTIVLLLIVTLLIPISFNGSASILQPQPTPPPVQPQSIPQQIPGNDAQIVENDTTVQPQFMPQQIPDSDNKTLTEMLGSERYNSGYNHGCSDARQGGHPYLYGSGGASNHTIVFMQGYNDGWRYCTTSVESRLPSIEIR